ncbi:hypothetical protein [Nonomuraea monospora]|uniref:hypothetical protein n=1 Tax=Nonomuraea monospora TaxID=568818 RepID=UPI0031D59A91
MRARDLITDLPAVTPATSIAAAARLLAQQRMPGLIVVDERGEPVSTPTGSCGRLPIARSATRYRHGLASFPSPIPRPRCSRWRR